MQVRLLGPIQVVAAGQVHPVPGLRRQGILALLALHHREIVGTGRLVHAVWQEAAAVAPNSVQSHVSHLRRLLNSRTAILARGPGYVLDIGENGVDVEVAERLVDRALRDADPAQRARALDSALRLGGGPELSAGCLTRLRRSPGSLYPSWRAHPAGLSRAGATQRRDQDHREPVLALV